MKQKRVCSLVLALLFAAAMLTGCGGAATTASGAAADTVGQTENMSPEEAGFVDAVPDTTLPQPPSDAKLIYTGHISLETLNLTPAYEALTELVSRFNGFYEQQEMNHRGNYQYASYTVRVPADQYEAFQNAVSEHTAFRLTYHSTSCENVSETYGDIENRIETLQIKQERLQELLGKAESMDDIIAIESKMAEVEAELAALNGEKNHYDNLIDYATVYVELSEVSTFSEGVNPTMGQRLAAGFRKGMQNFAEGVENLLVWFVSNLLLIVVVVLVVVVVVLLIRKQKKKKKAKQMPPTAE